MPTIWHGCGTLACAVQKTTQCDTDCCARCSCCCGCLPVIGLVCGVAMLPFVLCILLLGWTLIALMYTPLNFYLAYRGVVGTRLYVLPQQFLAPPV